MCVVSAYSWLGRQLSLHGNIDTTEKEKKKKDIALEHG